MNKVMLLGRLTKNPEIKSVGENKVCNFSLAVNRKFVKEGEERQADFISIVCWGKLADFCSKYFSKGQQVNVVGRLQTRTWEDDNSIKHYATNVVAEEMYFADSKRTGDFSTNNTFTDINNGDNVSADFLKDFDDDLPF